MRALYCSKMYKIIPLYKELAKKHDVEFFDVNQVAEVGKLDLLHLTPEAHVALGEALAPAVIKCNRKSGGQKTA